MQTGLFTREGRSLVGRIGSLELSWDRHKGGRLSLSHRRGGSLVPVGAFSMEARLEGAVLRSADDPDPRLIPVEAGPHRLVLRVVQRLRDGDGIHLGDAMQETWAWADGPVYLSAMLRLVHPGRGGRLLAAGASLPFAGGWNPAGGDGIRLAHESGLRTAVLSYRGGGLWAFPPGVAEPQPADARIAWELVEPSGPPFYRSWGPYFEQWGGPAGWSSLRLEEGPALRAAWTEGDPLDREPVQGFHGLLALLCGEDGDAVERQVRAFEQPPTPSVTGGTLLFHSPMDGTTTVRKTAPRMTVTYPSCETEGRARLCVRGIGPGPAVRVGRSEALPFPVAGGGVDDDPNGPNLVRPDDRHGPILTDGDRAPDELLTTFDLAAGRQTEVELASAPGVALATQKWDDRGNLLLFSSAQPRGNLGSLSLRDLKMRDLKVPGDTAPSMARLPLYWFLANANSAHHCLNEPKSVDLVENGPDAVRLRITSENPAGTAVSEVDATIPYLEDRLRFDLRCRFSARETWDVAAIQYCNFFPEERRHPQEWGTDRVLVISSDGQRMLVDHRGAGEQRILSGEKFQQYEGNLFVALYGGPRGDILALSRPRSIPGARQEYVLCECWLDNHLNLGSTSETIAAGTCWEMDLTLLLTRPTSVDEDIEALGRRALEAGEL